MALAPFVAVNADTAKPASTIPPPLAIGTVAPDFTVQDPSGAPVHLSDYKGKVVVIDFWATWCGPCKMIAPILDEIAREQGEKVRVAKIDVDQNQALAARFNIRGIPTMILFQNGEPKETIVGLTGKQAIVSKLEALSAAA